MGVPDSRNIRHSFEIRFTFPVTLAEKISDACCATAGGMTAVREADGIWRNCNGTRVKDEMRLGIVTVKNEIKIDYLRQRIGRILAEYGEECMWFVYNAIQGGVFNLEKKDMDIPISLLKRSYTVSSQQSNKYNSVIKKTHNHA